MTVVRSRLHRTSSRLVCTSVCGTSTRGEFSEYRACALGRARLSKAPAQSPPPGVPAAITAALPERRPTSAPGSPACRATTETSAPSPTRSPRGRVCRITGQRAQRVHELGDGLIAHDRLDPIREPLRRLDTDGQQPEDQLRPHQQRRGGLRTLRDGCRSGRRAKTDHADQQHQQAKADGVRPGRDGTGIR